MSFETIPPLKKAEATILNRIKTSGIIKGFFRRFFLNSIPFLKYSKKINAYNKMCCGERDGFFINKETLANKMVPAISDKNLFSVSP